MFNFVDLFILILVVYLVWQGFRTGLAAGLLNVLATISSFVFATLTYNQIGSFLSQTFKINENIALVLGFVIALFVLEFCFNFVLTYIYSRLAPVYKKSNFVAKIDKYLGFLPSVLVGLFLTSLLMLLILTLPIKAWLRDPIQESLWGKKVASLGITYLPTVERTLNKLPYKNLVYILTPKSSSSEDIQSLNIPENLTLNNDPQSEMEMFDLVNKERQNNGLKKLKFNNSLRDVGRNHCQDMFERRYFSHYTPEGASPFDRIQDAGIDYLAAGENLAYAPSVAIAHQGLMNSKGHRENILRAEFGTLGVGVIDSGFQGKMFCQEFTN